MKSIFIFICLTVIHGCYGNNSDITRGSCIAGRPFDDALLAEVKQCICALKDTVHREECCETLESIEDKIEEALSSLDEINLLLGLEETNVEEILQIIAFLVSAIEQGGIVSLIDFLTQLDEIVESLIIEVESNIEINETVLSTVNVIDTRTESIYSIDQLIASQVHIIDTHLDTLESLAMVLGHCNSCESIIMSNIDALTAVSQEGFDQMITLDQTIVSQVDQLQAQLNVIESLVTLLQEEGCCSLIAVIENQMQEITSLIDTINIEALINELSELINTIEQSHSLIDLLENLPSHLEMLDLCTSTSITTAPYTISTPGIYCLANDVTGIITIDAPNVTLNLNNHTLTGGVLIDVTDDEFIIIDNVTITNGTIINSGITHGINILNTSEENSFIGAVYLHALYIENSDLMPASNGINIGEIVVSSLLNIDYITVNNQLFGLDLGEDFNTYINLIITNSNFSNSSACGFLNDTQAINVIYNSLIKNCQANNNGEIGFSLGSGIINIENCFALNNSEVGFDASFTSNESIIKFKDCIASGLSGIGFYAQGSNAIILFEQCFAAYSQVGFQVSGNDFIFKNCLAVQNNVAGFVNAGIVGTGSWYQCSAIANSGDGFYSGNNIGTLLLHECVATENSGNNFNMDSNQGSITLQNCSACQGVTTGFNMTNNTGTIVIEACSATNNASIGFDAGSSTGIQEVSSYATGNGGGDYNPSAGAPFFATVATTAGISGWYNVYS